MTWRKQNQVLHLRMENDTAHRVVNTTQWTRHKQGEFSMQVSRSLVKIIKAETNRRKYV